MQEKIHSNRSKMMIYPVRILWKLSQAPANVVFPGIAHVQSFKPIWNVRAAFIGWKVSAKKACVKIHIVWHAINITYIDNIQSTSLNKLDLEYCHWLKHLSWECQQTSIIKSKHNKGAGHSKNLRSRGKREEQSALSRYNFQTKWAAVKKSSQTKKIAPSAEASKGSQNRRSPQGCLGIRRTLSRLKKTNIDNMYMYPSSPHKNNSNTMEKIRSNSWENLTQYYLLTCRIVVNIIVWKIGRRKQAAGQ